jgi:Cu-processing system permease protein
MADRSLSRVLAVASNAYRETVRERVLYNLVFFAIVMTLAGLLLGKLSIRQETKIIKDIGLSAIDIFGTLIAVFLGVGLVSKEIERRSAYPLLAKPISRGEFIVGKFFGLATTLAVNVIMMTIGLYATLFLTSGRVEPALLKAIFPIYLGLVLTVAVALFFSTLTSSALAAISTVCFVVAGRYSDVIHNMREIVESAPGWLVLVLYYLVPNFANFDLKTCVVYGDPVAWLDLLWVTVYAAIYIGALLTGSILVFRKRDLA